MTEGGRELGCTVGLRSAQRIIYVEHVTGSAQIGRGSGDSARPAPGTKTNCDPSHRAVP